MISDEEFYQAIINLWELCDYKVQFDIENFLENKKLKILKLYHIISFTIYNKNKGFQNHFQIKIPWVSTLGIEIYKSNKQVLDKIKENNLIEPIYNSITQKLLELI